MKPVQLLFAAVVFGLFFMGLYSNLLQKQFNLAEGAYSVGGMAAVILITIYSFKKSNNNDSATAEEAQERCRYIAKTFNPREHTAKNPEDQMRKAGISDDQIAIWKKSIISSQEVCK